MGLQMKLGMAVIVIMGTMEAVAQQMGSNVTMRVREHDRDRDGQPDSYLEVVKDGSNFVFCVSREDSKTETSVRLDERHTLSVIDTNGDGRSDQFWFCEDAIPQSVWLRNASN